MLSRASTAKFRLRSKVLGPRVLDLALRLGSAELLPYSFRARFRNGGVPHSDLEWVLRRVRSLYDWDRAWVELAEERERLARQAEDEGRCAAAVEHWLVASAAYHYAQFILLHDVERKRKLHARSVVAYAWAAHRLEPPATRLEVSFEGALLPGYLRCPRDMPRPPVVVNVNGANTIKEEFRLWEDQLLARGVATFSLDGPGSGEGWDQLPLIVDYERFGRVVADFLEARVEADPKRFALFGPSLGGLLALRMAAHDARFRACVAVSAPYDATPYWDDLLPMTRQEISHLLKLSGEPLRQAVAAGSVKGLVKPITCPLLVVGGGGDLVVPGDEARAIYEEATCPKELWFFPNASHGCLDVPDVLARMADWLAKQLAESDET